MSINPLLNPDSKENKSLNLYCNTITTAESFEALSKNKKELFEPNITDTTNYDNPENCQGNQGNFDWVLEEDDVSATIYGQYRSQGTLKDAVIEFEIPTGYDTANSNNICILGSGRSVDFANNPNGAVFNAYECEIYITAPLNPPVMRILWRTTDNTDDPVLDFKYFRFMATYKK